MPEGRERESERQLLLELERVGSGWRNGAGRWQVGAGLRCAVLAWARWTLDAGRWGWRDAGATGRAAPVGRYLKYRASGRRGCV